MPPRGVYIDDMKCLVLAAAAAILHLTTPTFAQTTRVVLDGTAEGTLTLPAQGEVEVISNSGHQFIKFNNDFAVVSQAESEVRLVDGETGKVSFIGYLNRDNGYQIYEVPPHLNVEANDKIVIYSPLHAENLATVELDDE